MFDKLHRRYGGSSLAKGTPLPVPSSPMPYYHPQSPGRHNGSRKHSQPGDRDDAAPVRVPTKSTKHSAADTSDETPDALVEALDFEETGMDEAAAPDPPLLLRPDETGDEERAIGGAARPTAGSGSSLSLKQFVAKKRLNAASEAKKALWRDHSAFPGDDDEGDTTPRPEDPVDTETTVRGPLAGALEAGELEEELELEHELESCESDDFASMSRADAALRAAECEEFELAFRLCLLEDDAQLLKQVMGVVGTPCMQQLSRASRSALCAAFLELLEDDGDGEGPGPGTTAITDPQCRNSKCCDDGRRHCHDEWLVFAWLRELGAQQVSVAQLDPRVLRALEERLRERSASPTSAGLEAARVLALLGL